MGVLACQNRPPRHKMIGQAAGKRSGRSVVLSALIVETFDSRRYWPKVWHKIKFRIFALFFVGPTVGLI